MYLFRPGLSNPNIYKYHCLYFITCWTLHATDRILKHNYKSVMHFPFLSYIFRKVSLNRRFSSSKTQSINVFVKTWESSMTRQNNFKWRIRKKLFSLSYWVLYLLNVGIPFSQSAQSWHTHLSVPIRGVTARGLKLSSESRSEARKDGDVFGNSPFISASVLSRSPPSGFSGVSVSCKMLI